MNKPGSGLNLWLKTPLNESYNFSRFRIEIVVSCSGSYTLELSLLALKAAIRVEKSCKRSSNGVFNRLEGLEGPSFCCVF